MAKYYPPILLTTYNQSDVYYIDDIRAGYKPKDFNYTELRGVDNG